MFQVIDLKSGYGKLSVISEINLSLKEGEIVAIIGPNGAGKSTLLKTLAGHLRPHGGRVVFRGEDITYWHPWKSIGVGITLVPEGRYVFGGLTVEENLWLGTFPVRAKLNKENKNVALGVIFDLFPRLKERRKQIAKTLSGGEQQMLSIGRSLISKPQLLLLDEPSIGLAPIVRSEIFRRLEWLHSKEKLSILLVEQDIEGALSIASYVHLMQTGKLLFGDKSSELIKNVDAVYQSIFGRS